MEAYSKRRADLPRPSISILLCNYNHAKYLPESLGGILGQTERADEVVIVDDGSTDGSVEVIERLVAGHPNVKFLPQGQNRGLMAAIEIALANATSDFVVWASADDRLLEGFVARNKDVLAEHPRAALSFSRLATFRDGTEEIREYTGDAATGPAFDLGERAHFLSPEGMLERLSRSYLWMSGNTVVARRSAIVEAGSFRPELMWHSEWFTFYAIALRHGACLIPETLALIREVPGTFSASGMNDPKRQLGVLRNLAAALREEGNRDLAEAFLKRPTLLSPFGGPMLKALLHHPRSVPLAWRYGHWLSAHWAGILAGRAAASGEIRARLTAKLCGLTAHWLDSATPAAWR
jgi:glycosyltransferase involved in cell wall biosynthesis